MSYAISSLNGLGQSIWFDGMSRRMILSGRIQKIIESGATGVTTNPTILLKSFLESKEYDDDIQKFALSKHGFFEPENRVHCVSIYDTLIVPDIIKVADLLLPIYNDTQGSDGYISIEVDPAFSFRLPHILENARWLWNSINRPNVMIKIPATLTGIDAIRQLTREGINTNATLIFSLEQYEAVANAYIDGLEERILDKKPLNKVCSVASFFISRIDTRIDRIIDRLQLSDTKFRDVSVRGYAATASARIAYDMFKILFYSNRFHALEKQGAMFQKLLWASTQPKDEQYSPLKYIHDLAGPMTINTVPAQTLDILTKSNEKFTEKIDKDVTIAYDYMDQWLNAALLSDETNFSDVADGLIEDGIEIFCISFDEIVAFLHSRLKLEKMLGNEPM